MTILVKKIFPIENTSEYKIHFARNNTAVEPIDGGEPLDIWTGDKEKEEKNELEWQDWQEYFPGTNAFSLPYIFSLMRFYHETDTWLFGGVFRVLERHEDRYKVELADIGKNFIRRLKIKYSYDAMQPRPNMEPYYSEFEVKEILPEPYKHKKPS